MRSLRVWSFAGVGLDYRFFSLPPDLVARLREWCERVWSVWDDSTPGDAWLADGHRPCDEAAAAMATTYELVWDLDNDDQS